MATLQESACGDAGFISVKVIHDELVAYWFGAGNSFCNVNT